MRSWGIVALTIAGVLLLYLLIPKGGQGIVAFCGAASKPALEAAAAAFERETGIRVELYFGGSGDVLSRMVLSASGDLYIPGSPEYMTKAIELGVVEPSSVRVLAYLVPAVIVPKGNPKGIAELRDLARPGVRVAIADPESVCVGEYAVEVLKCNGLYGEVSANIVMYAESCSKLAALPVMGVVDAVIGWDVFHAWNPNETEIIHLEPSARVPKLAYVPAAISRYSKNPDAARRFLDFLSSQKGRRCFEEAGYLIAEEEARGYAPRADVPKVVSDEIGRE